MITHKGKAEGARIFASQGYSVTEISRLTHMSEKEVVKRTGRARLKKRLELAFENRVMFESHAGISCDSTMLLSVMETGGYSVLNFPVKLKDFGNLPFRYEAKISEIKAATELPKLLFDKGYTPEEISELTGIILMSVRRLFGPKEPIEDRLKKALTRTADDPQRQIAAKWEVLKSVLDELPEGTAPESLPFPLHVAGPVNMAYRLFPSGTPISEISGRTVVRIDGRYVENALLDEEKDALEALRMKGLNNRQIGVEACLAPDLIKDMIGKDPCDRTLILNALANRTAADAALEMQVEGSALRMAVRSYKKDHDIEFLPFGANLGLGDILPQGAPAAWVAENPYMAIEKMQQRERNEG